MTQKDFELIARVLSDDRHDVWEECRTSLAHGFAAQLALVNPRFKRDVFLRACGVESPR